MTAKETLADLMKHPGCEVSGATRAKVLSALPREDVFVRSRLLGEYVVDEATGIRTRRPEEERIVWRFVPTDDLSAEGKKSPRQGSGLRGKRTRAMLRQFEDFETYLLENPVSEIGQGKTLGARANQFWASRRKEFETKAKGRGEAKGYPSAKALASAYRTSKN